MSTVFWGLSGASVRGALLGDGTLRRYAFYGDSLLGWLVARVLWERGLSSVYNAGGKFGFTAGLGPGEAAGQLSVAKAYYVSNERLARYADDAVPQWLGSMQAVLDEAGVEGIIWDAQSEHNKGTIMEALLWAVYLARGEREAEDVVRGLVEWGDAQRDL